MSQLRLGVVGATRKENEHRLPIHPHHFDRIAADVRASIYLEAGYGEYFGVGDTQLSGWVAGMRSREQLIAECDVILLLKPHARDLAELRTSQVVWGWPHCVQDSELTQHAIDNQQTLIALESMNLWRRDGSFKLHVFHKNNEIAGYCSVLHAMSIVGSSGTYGRRLRAAVIGFGATARGAVTALNTLGVHDINVLTNRVATEVAAPIHPARIVHFHHAANSVGGSPVSIAVAQEGRLPLAGYLAQHDIIVNCVLQDTNEPLIFLDDDDLAALRPNSLIVDVSCDEAMGFSWARPTTFEQPTFVVGANVTYYAVDHSPSYLWNSATWEISEALLPYLPIVLAGRHAWQADQTVRRAIEILDGTVLNPNILSFQNRQTQYPHARRGRDDRESA